MECLYSSLLVLGFVCFFFSSSHQRKVVAAASFAPRRSDGEVLEVRHNDVSRLGLLFVVKLQGVAVPFLALDVPLLALLLFDLFFRLG